MGQTPCLVSLSEYHSFKELLIAVFVVCCLKSKKIGRKRQEALKTSQVSEPFSRVREMKTARGLNISLTQVKTDCKDIVFIDLHLVIIYMSWSLNLSNLWPRSISQKSSFTLCLDKITNLNLQLLMDLYLH